MLRFIHAADMHMDSPFAGLGGAEAKARREEQRRQLAELRELCRNADLLLLSGDLLDSARAYGETREALEEFFAGLSVPAFIAPGNHDWFSAQSPYGRMRLPEHVHLFTSPEPEPVEVPELGCTVWGAAFLGETAGPVLRGFRADAVGTVQLMVLHGDVTEGESRYCPVTREDISLSGLDYLALGHRHSFSGLRREGRTRWAYPGCTLGRGFDETGEKGVILGEIEGEDLRIRFHPLPGRRYRILTVDVTGAESLTEAARRAVPEDAAEDILRLTLTGEWAGKPNTEVLAETLKDLCGSLEIRDETRLSRDIRELAEEDTLRGAFLRSLMKRADRADAALQARLTLAARFGLAALEYREDM
jgi:DNA repair exonuclease SbcCD nuclease subunit